MAKLTESNMLEDLQSAILNHHDPVGIGMTLYFIALFLLAGLVICGLAIWESTRSTRRRGRTLYRTARRARRFL